LLEDEDNESFLVLFAYVSPYQSKVTFTPF